jgi:hypothetical protein
MLERERDIDGEGLFLVFLSQKKKSLIFYSILVKHAESCAKEGRGRKDGVYILVPTIYALIF